jgi:hypothetical protein
VWVCVRGGLLLCSVTDKGVGVRVLCSVTDKGVGVRVLCSVTDKGVGVRVLCSVTDKGVGVRVLLGFWVQGQRVLFLCSLNPQTIKAGVRGCYLLSCVRRCPCLEEWVCLCVRGRMCIGVCLCVCIGPDVLLIPCSLEHTHTYTHTHTHTQKKLGDSHREDTFDKAVWR